MVGGTGRAASGGRVGTSRQRFRRAPPGRGDIFQDLAKNLAPSSRPAPRDEAVHGAHLPFRAQTNMSLLFAALLAFLPPTPSSDRKGGDDKPVLTLEFGVYQSDKATVMYRKRNPVLECLQDDLDPRLGRSADIHLTIFKTYDEGIDSLVQ